MAQVLIRDLPDEVVARLKARAAAHGRSLEAELREILGSAARVDRRELLEVADRLADKTRGRVATDSEDLLAEDRRR